MKLPAILIDHIVGCVCVCCVRACIYAARRTGRFATANRSRVTFVSQKFIASAGDVADLVNFFL